MASCRIPTSSTTPAALPIRISLDTPFSSIRCLVPTGQGHSPLTGLPASNHLPFLVHPLWCRQHRVSHSPAQKPSVAPHYLEQRPDTPAGPPGLAASPVPHTPRLVPTLPHPVPLGCCASTQNAPSPFPPGYKPASLAITPLSFGRIEPSTLPVFSGIQTRRHDLIRVFK